MTELIALTLLVVVFSASLYLFISDDSLTHANDRREELAGIIDGLLPQTQCRECGFNGCRPYAEAIVGGTTDIYRCVPGGATTASHLAELLGRGPSPLYPGPASDARTLVACIDETACIGCVKCISACPVDAIIGAAKQLHSVMPEACTGCGLCVPPCPVDCIAIIPVETGIKCFVWSKPQPGITGG